ncbi:E1B 19k [Murine adenovirus 3]|uniref:E1B 19k n=1 Tax=Murine adenovirus 3 TaxID=573199 RepID=C3SAT3_9ADEN|nr:E1B 19k [Murine adenovirus 3]ACJ14503.1 E1B 19k [Murine adenovirus 3]
MLRVFPLLTPFMDSFPAIRNLLL